MLEAILPTFALFCAFALPVLFGLGISSGYNILYYPLLVIMLAMLALAAGGLASILVMAVARIFPPRRVAEVLGLLGATASFLCGQSSNIIRAINPDRAAVTGTLNFFTQMNTPWSPMSWAGRGLQAIGSGDWLPGFGLTVLSLLLAGALFGGTLFLAEHLYYSGWSSMQASSRRKRPVRAAAAAPAAPVLPAAITPVSRAIHLIPRPIRGLMVKDFIVIRRDPRNLSGLIMPLVLGLIFLFTAQGPGRDPAEFLNEKGLSNLEVFGLLALALFVGWILLFTLATLSFSREGKNYWFIKSAPIRPWHLLTAKFLVAFVPSVAFSLLYLVIAYLIRGADWAYFPFITLIILMVMAGATGISLAFGAAGANLEWDDPRKMHLRGTTGCLVYIAVLAFMAVDLAFFVLPPVLWQIFTHGSSLWMYLGGSLFGIAIALVCAYLPLRMVVPRLPKIGEPD